MEPFALFGALFAVMMATEWASINLEQMTCMTATLSLLNHRRKIMDEYIKRSDALNASKIVYIEYIEIDGDGEEDGNADDIPVVFKRDIEAIPAADVQPIVWAYWKTVEHKKSRVCSHCESDEPYKFADEEANVYSYCPYCGAKMANH